MEVVEGVVKIKEEDGVKVVEEEVVEESVGGNIEKSQEDVYFFRNFSKKTWEGPLKVVGRRKSRKVVGRWRSQKDVSRKMKIGRRPPEGTGNHVGKRKTR